jgi:hypothetical protein
MEKTVIEKAVIGNENVFVMTVLLLSIVTNMYELDSYLVIG